MVFDGAKSTLQASTRNGATLEYDKHDLVKALSDPDFEFRVPAAPSGSEWHPIDHYVVYSSFGESWSFGSIKEARGFRDGLSVSGSCVYRIGRVTLDGLWLNRDIESQEAGSWDLLARSNIFGLILSRMQSDRWNIDMDQDFRLKYIPKSWCGRRGAVVSRLESEILTFANSTSFAFHDVANLIRVSRWNRLWKVMYKQGSVTLAELNRRRSTVSLPPISATYMKRFRVSHVVKWGFDPPA